MSGRVSQRRRFFGRATNPSSAIATAELPSPKVGVPGGERGVGDSLGRGHEMTPVHGRTGVILVSSRGAFELTSPAHASQGRGRS